MIKDTTQLQGFNNIKLPKIKGEVEIRLHNPTTGKTEIHKGENMITNAVRDIFASNYCGAFNYTKCLPLWEKMYGGVLCFSSQLNLQDTQQLSAADDYFIPTESANSITAHAGQSTVSDQTDDPKRGSKSAGNMVVQDGSVKLAWEWGLTEGNGQISALALTHTDVGTAGTGATSTAFSTMIPTQCLQYGTNGLTVTNNIHFFDNDNYGYCVDPIADHTVRIKRYPKMYQQVGLVGRPFTPTTDVLGDAIFEYKDVDECVCTMNSWSGTIRYRPYYYFDKATSILYLFATNTAGAGKSATVYVDVINLSNWSNISHNKWTWSLGTAVGGLRSPHFAIPLPVYEGYVYLPIYGSYFNYGDFIRVSLTSSPIASDITHYNGDTQITGAFIPNASDKILVSKGVVFNGNKSYKTAWETPDGWGWYDMSQSCSAGVVMNSEIGLTAIGYMSNNSPTYYVSHSKFYLGTKFNLPNMVTKSAAQSMIITYTLTEVASND